MKQMSLHNLPPVLSVSAVSGVINTDVCVLSGQSNLATVNNILV